MSPTKGHPRRRAAAAAAVWCALLALVVAGAVQLIERDRRQITQRFGAERLVHLDEAVELTRRDLEGVAVVLRMASELVQRGRPESELAALLASSEHLQRLVVYDVSGAEQLSVDNPRHQEPLDSRAELFAMAERALARPGDLQISSPLKTSGTRSRRIIALAVVGERAHALALVVDSNRLMSKLGMLASDPSTHLLLLGPHGRPSAPSHPALVDAVTRGALPPSLQRILAAVRRNERGTEWVRAGEAIALGLGDADLVGTYAPLQTDGLGQWSLVMLTSTAALRETERNVTGRLVAAASAIAVLLLVFGVFAVVTARRSARTEERLLQAEALARMRERTEKTLDAIPAGVMSLSSKLEVTSLNRVLRDRSPQVPLPSPLEAVLPEAPASVLERLTALVAAANEKRAVQSIHGEQLALFGNEAQYSVHAVPLGEAYDDTRALLVFEDVSEVRSLESQLLRAEKLATIGVLAAGLAHEVGTPLGIVRARAEYVLGKLGSSHAQAGGLTVIIEQIDRVTRTIRQMLDFARVRPASVRPVSPAQLAVWLDDVMRYEAQRRKVKLEVRLPPQLPYVSADPDQLQQVLLNVVMNAFDACREGGHVTVSAEVASDAWRSLRIDVNDDGCGIPEDQRQGVFDPFFTTKKGGQGTGLGLTVAAQIVRNHGGRIELSSEVGRGTRVSVLWPLAQAQAKDEVGSHAA